MLAPSAMRCFWRLRARNPHDPNAPETPGRRCPHVGHVSTGWHKFKGLPPVYGFRASQAPLNDSSSMSLVPGFRTTDWSVACLGEAIGPWRNHMRRITFSLLAVSLLAGSSAWATGANDDKDTRSSEKSSPSPEKKPSETAKPGTNPGTPPAASAALESEVQQLRQLVQEQAERLRGLQQRLTDVGGGLSTSFGTIPFSNTPAGRLSENRLSAQYSRLSLKVDAPVTNATSMTAYVETDFFGFQPPNANITSNSYGLRLREFWADVKHGNWEVLGGQDWSLLQANRRGLSPYTPDVFYTYNEDQNFQVGLVWARQAQFRVTYHPTQKLAVGVSAENPQQFAPASVVFPSTTFLTQFDNGSSATNTPSGSTNTAVPNLHPDIIVKAAYDSELMRRPFHVEVAGLIRSFRVLNTLVTPNRTDTITGGGGAINLNLQLVKNFTLIANSFYSDGGGRYLGGLGPDVIVKPNGDRKSTRLNSSH